MVATNNAFNNRCRPSPSLYDNWTAVLPTNGNNGLDLEPARHSIRKDETSRDLSAGLYATHVQQVCLRGFTVHAAFERPLELEHIRKCARRIGRCVRAGREHQSARLPRGRSCDRAGEDQRTVDLEQAIPPPWRQREGREIDERIEVSRCLDLARCRRQNL